MFDRELSVLASAASSPASASLVYLGALGNVLDKVTLVTTPFSTLAFTQLEQAVTIPAGVAQVRVVLAGFAPPTSPPPTRSPSTTSGSSPVRHRREETC